MSEKDTGKSASEDAVEVEAEIIDAEIVSEGKPKSRKNDAILLTIALIVGLIAGPFIQTLLSPYLPAALQPMTLLSDAQDQRGDEVDNRFAELQQQQQNTVSELARMAQQIRELRAAEVSRNTSEVQKVDSSAFSAELKKLEERLRDEILASNATIEQLMADIKSVAAPVGDAVRNIDTTELQARLNTMEANLLKFSGELELALRQARQLAKDVVQPVDGRVTDLADKIDAMAREAGKRVAAIKRETFAIALVQLRAAIANGQAFGDLLAALIDRFGGDDGVDPALEVLKTHAGAGVKNLTTLKAELQPVIRLILNGSNNTNTGFWSQTKERLARLITVRRTGDIAGDSVEAILARAEHAMDRLALGDGVAEMKSLPEAERRLARSWISDGEAHLAIEAALLKLEQRVVMQAGSD